MWNYLRIFGAPKIPAEWKYGKVRCIILDSDKYTDKKAYAFLLKKYPDYRDAIFGGYVKGFCSELTENDKLIITGHGSRTGLIFAWQTDELIHYLKLWGLKRIGVLKFHTCNIGEREWLRELGEKMLKNGISFSYISGAAGTGKKGHYIYDLSTGLSYTPGGYKIIQGNIRRDFAGTRYVSKNISPRPK
ncbi:hypothetical protein SAMN04487787_13110 [Kosakonia sacchari]|nr:hypothetical protein SAMN04487787_13110 [Kosakonia sacchari]